MSSYGSNGNSGAGAADGGSGYQQGGNDAEYASIDGSTQYNSGGKKKLLIAGGTVVLLVAAFFGVLSFGQGGELTDAAKAAAQDAAVADADLPTSSKTGKLKLFDDNNRFLMEDYDARSTFASFLPGVAGYFGKPVWAFYVNRGQGISTFGTESKDYPLLEFNAANKAYQLTPFIGFRTFIRGTRMSSDDADAETTVDNSSDKLGSVGDSATSISASVSGALSSAAGAVSSMVGTSFDIEPFAPSRSRNLENENDDPTKPKRILYVGTNEMEVQEIDGVNGITTSVQYFILPEEDFASLIRRTKIENTGSTPLKISLLDGLAKIEPAGGRLDGMLKSMSRTLEGWFGVYQVDKESKTMPFYKMSTEPSDQAKVMIERHGHYCLSFFETSDKPATLLPIVFDTDKVFGKDTSLEHPKGLYASSVGGILDGDQFGDAKTSSAFAAVREITIAPGSSITVASVYGKAEDMKELKAISKVVTQPNFVADKFARARSLIDELTAGVETTTVNPLFDGAVKQMFLDNSLRGGMPTIVGNIDGDTTYDEDSTVKVFHSFSRIHGDLERDYNAFQIMPQYFSQGPGNYRDVAQNRRDDVTFLPRMGSFDIQMFLSFIQADGYEPLTVEAVVYIFHDAELAKKIANQVTTDADSGRILGEIISGGPFRPGQLFQLCDDLNINRTKDNEAFLHPILAAAEDRAMAVYGTGYWADHWDYYIDMIESYLSIFPDGEESLMYDKKLRYFFSTATVKPRAEKYVLDLTFDGKSKHVIQLDSTYFDGQKVKEQEAFRDQNTGLLGIDASWQRDGKGTAYMSSPIAKLFLLASIKFAMRDAWGMGIEYEGGRPGWLDSMNGLPGMVGSGMPETYELYLLMKYVKKVVDKYDRDVIIPSELHKMLVTVETALDELDAFGYSEPEDIPLDVPHELFKYWDTVAAARENYRNDVEYYFSGNSTTYTAKKVSGMVDRWLDHVETGMKRALKFGTKGYGDDGTSGIPPAFFSYDVTEWELNNEHTPIGLPLVNAKAMKVGIFPLFLEGPVRYMKTVQDSHAKMVDMYERVLESGLRDDELKMYYLSASLQGQTYDMGRQIAFAPGWLENQSIWMHMSYKYYLQLIRGKLYEQFFAEMKGGGILPFMDPEVYGRPLMECSSFIASSAFPDPDVHGRGFLARLSGSTAEFMSMWKHMFIGPNPFFLNDNDEVEMQLTPALPSWLFEDDSSDNEPTFDEDGSHIITFKLFAKILVTYHNPGAQNIYGTSPKSYKVTMKDGSVVDVDGSIIPTETALKIRRGTEVESLDAYF
mmetsp:Transcript_22935/g.64986  ORF Transcript_22935/g.64986 Transcript_22935/m.64986 type:complete len:1287 (+) Transcript_22935:154-4014(+)|eukprot:CAMPEP_0119563668 /NCGR_PEP_ID=MMETSP1352-20130426/24282_1 /TAXON_ID=265584 /ORGANISM="Stauroneis constricta, Strain CCMP1120" /LENGTH=1286 /DNA_ID=CAMNT_0007612305 /DNA_START=52 /DNA_END=3912 /DNA_ORIENTATION=-